MASSSESSNDKDVRPVKVSLSKTQKILDRLRKLLNQSPFSPPKKTRGYYGGDKALSNFVTVGWNFQPADMMEEEMITSIKTQRVRLEDHLILLHEVSKVREALFQGNIESGVSAILNELSDLKKMKSLFEGLKKSVCNSNSQLIPAEFFHKFYETHTQKCQSVDAASSTFNVSGEIFDTDELSERLFECTKRADQLEDERDKINHTFTISLNLSEATMNSIGI